jgi:hypothetical protein
MSQDLKEQRVSEQETRIPHVETSNISNWF